MKRILIIGIVALGLQLSSCDNGTSPSYEVVEIPEGQDSSVVSTVHYSNGVTKLQETENFVLYRHREVTPEWVLDKKLHEKIDRIDSIMDVLAKEIAESRKSYNSY